jgi:single stranded DNA-binding protein
MTQRADIQVEGHAGKGDPDVRMTKGEDPIPVASFSLAMTKRKQRNGEWVDAGTTWWRVTAWRKVAEYVAENVRQGVPVFVTGEQTTGEPWTDRDGNERPGGLEINANRVVVLPAKARPEAGMPSGEWEPQSQPW